MYTNREINQWSGENTLSAPFAMEGIHMQPKVLVRIGNVYFASRWFGDKFGTPKEGEIQLSQSKLFARRYDDASEIIRDAKILGVTINNIKIERIA